MNFVVFVLALGILTTEAVAVQPASNGAIAVITKDLTAANGNAKKLSSDEQALAAKLSAIKEVERNAPGWRKPADILQLERVVAAGKKDLEVQRIKIAREVMAAYGVVDTDMYSAAVMPRGTPELRGLPRRTITWGVFCTGNREEPPTYKTNGNRLDVEKPVGDTKALTSAQGHTDLNPDLFSPDPNGGWSSTIVRLGIVLYHERIHFEQYTNPALANRSLNFLEVKAHERTRDNLPSFGLSQPALAAWKELEQEKVDHYQNEVRLETGREPQLHFVESPAENEALNARADEFERLVEGEIAREREARRARPAVLSTPATVAHREAPAQPAVLDRTPEQRERNAKEQLQWLQWAASAVCTDPSEFDRYNFPGGIGEHWDSFRSTLQWLRDRGETVDFSEDSLFSGLPQCETRVLREMIRLMGHGVWVDPWQARQAADAGKQICQSMRQRPIQEDPGCRVGCRGSSQPTHDDRTVGHLGFAYGQLQRW